VSAATSRSDTLAQRRRRSLSIRSRPATRRAPIDRLRHHAQTPIVHSRPRLCVPTQLPSHLRHVHHRGRRRHQIPIGLAARPVPNFPRLRALALFGRRPAQRADASSLPASKNLHICGRRRAHPSAVAHSTNADAIVDLWTDRVRPPGPVPGRDRWIDLPPQDQVPQALGL
jgi:hypothetical protein